MNGSLILYQGEFQQQLDLTYLVSITEIPLVAFPLNGFARYGRQELFGKYDESIQLGENRWARFWSGDANLRDIKSFFTLELVEEITALGGYSFNIEIEAGKLIVSCKIRNSRVQRRADLEAVVSVTEVIQKRLREAEYINPNKRSFRLSKQIV